MAKDKTKPRPELSSKREAIRKEQAAQRAAHRRRLAVNWIIAVVIIGLVVTGITYVVLHVQAGNHELETDGPASVTQVTPPNAGSDNLAIWANPDAKLASDAITVDMHVDFQSGDAVNAMQFYDAALASLANEGKIKLYYHLHTSMDSTYSNTASTRGAEAATCADTIGAFSDYLQAAYAGANLTPSAGAVGFTDDQLQKQFPATANITGANLTAFKQCYSGRATSTFVKAMDAANQSTAVPNNTDYASGVTTTPVMLANNRTVDISTDMNNATSGPKSEADLLTLLQTTIAAPPA